MASNQELAPQPTTDFDFAAAAERAAEAILRASGSSLRNYSMPETIAAIKLAALDAIGEAYQAGADFGARKAWAAKADGVEHNGYPA